MAWQEEFKRIKRWYYRVRENEDLNLEDFFLSFFTTCYHFRDWLIEEKIISKTEIDRFIEQKEALKICGDIANFSKHAKLIGKTWTGDLNTKTEGKIYGVMPFSGASYLTSVVTIESNGKTYKASDVVEGCMDVWAELLLSKSLEIPEMMEENIYANFVKWEPKNKRSHKS